MNSNDKIVDIDCLIVLIVGNFKNSNIEKLFTKYFINILRVENIEDAVELANNNYIDLVLCEDNCLSNNFKFTEHIRQIDENILTFFATNSLNTEDLLKSIDLKIDGYLLESSSEEILFKQIEETIIKYITNKKYKIFGKHLNSKNENIIISKANPCGIISYANDKFSINSGYTQDELIGSNHSIVRHPDNKKSIFDDLWYTISQKKLKWEGTVKNISKDRKAYYTKAIVIPILDKNKNVIEYLGLRANISEKLSEKSRLDNNIESNGLSILALIQIEEYEMIEELCGKDLIKKVDESFCNSLLSKLQNKDIFKRVYTLGHGKYALLCNFHSFIKRNSNMEKYFDELVKVTNESNLVIDNFKDELNIVLSYAYGSHNLFEDAQYGLEEAIFKNKMVHNSNDAYIREQCIIKRNKDVIKMVKVALDNFNIVSYFQPIINNKTGTIEKYESLVRLIDENNNVLEPCYFLDIAKGSCYYNKITNRVLENTFSVIDKINTDVSINISMSDIEKKETRNIFFKLLDENKEHAHRLVLELLEDENIKDFSIIKDFITEVKSKGVQIAIDDFGAGYSNFERLLIFEPDIIKIDGSLIKDIENDFFSRNLVETIASLSKKQNIKTVAEYVENENIFNILNEIGIDYSQGYFFGKPKRLKESVKYSMSV